MKNLLLLFLFLGGTAVYAQNTVVEDTPEGKQSRPWRFLVSPGVNLDLSGSSSDPNSALLGKRPTAASLLEFQLMYPISRKIEGYIRLQMNMYKDKKSEYSGLPNGFEDIFSSIFWPISTIHPSFDTGVRYRIGWNRWSVHPGVGIGYSYYLFRRSGTKGVGSGEGAYTLSYKQRAESVFVNAGIAVRYATKGIGFLSLGVDYQQPLQKSHARLTRIENGMETTLIYRTSQLGKSLNISVGYGILF